MANAMELTDEVNRINSLPLSDKERKKYQKDIANIYQIGLMSDINQSIKYANELKSEIERNLLIRKKQVLFLPVIIGYLIIIGAMIILNECNIIFAYNMPIIYGSLGGILSVIYQNNKFKIDYYVSDKLLYFESFKLILLSNVMSIIGYIAINSKILMGNILQGNDAQYLTFLIYILCGYSQTFIPNILNSFELKSTNKQNIQ